MNQEDDPGPMLAAKSIGKRYRSLLKGVKVQALDGVSVELMKGEACGLVGPNGAGKSTLIKILAGIERKDSGEVHIRSGGKSFLGYVPEKPMFYEELSAYQNLYFFADLSRVDEPEKVCTELLDEMGLGPRKDDPVGGFSKGMRQRVAIARAMLGDPSVLLLDEPFSGLDPSMALELRKAIIRLKGAGKTLFLSSHDLLDVEAICDTVVFMKAGKIVGKTFTKEVADKNATLQIVFARGRSTGLGSLRGVIEVREENDLGATIVLSRDDIPKLIRELVEKGEDIEEVRILNKGLAPLYSEIIMGEGEDAA